MPETERDHFVGVRLSESEFKRLKRIAESDGGLKPGVKARQFVIRGIEVEAPGP